ncbi:NAD(P)-binding domain-containing protein [Pseudonocardia sp. TRM90224]|uniref:NAD(P)-binding domain-containing protein n=1 Tax=Pseudonocardia sp. TRM90224 TaxID=2812678 RepID=UPI001E29437A|nr:NAD(P)-binding domain-containing protein [Pseudonocardia sp. TRM90224]
MTPLGFIGVGEIAAAIVDGVRGGPGPHPDIHLSPRGASTAAALARRHPGVRVCRDNQSVADAADLVVLAVRPGSVDEVLGDVRMRPGSILVSAVAGLDLGRLAQHVGPHVEVVRVIPLPAVRHREGLTAVHPPHPAVVDLFTPLGGVCEVPDEHAFAALSASTATISAQLAYLSSVAGWLTEQGVEPAVADSYVRSVFAGVGRGLNGDSSSLGELVAAHETPGGINEQLRRAWFDETARTALHDALDGILARVTSSSGD